MFENSGAKIKKLAIVLCWLGISASIIVGILTLVGAARMRSGYGYGYSSAAPSTLVVILGFFVLGPLLSWVSSYYMYGFGELIEKSCENNGELRMLRRELSRDAQSTPASSTGSSVSPTDSQWKKQSFDE